MVENGSSIIDLDTLASFGPLLPNSKECIDRLSVRSSLLIPFYWKCHNAVLRQAKDSHNHEILVEHSGALIKVFSEVSDFDDVAAFREVLHVSEDKRQITIILGTRQIPCYVSIRENDETQDIIISVDTDFKGLEFDNILCRFVEPKKWHPNLLVRLCYRFPRVMSIGVVVLAALLLACVILIAFFL
jgi:hypothetical protein